MHAFELEQKETKARNVHVMHRQFVARFGKRLSVSLRDDIFGSPHCDDW
jgi:hypothetical protein